MANEQWGSWSDPVAEEQLEIYEKQGFQLKTPEKHRADTPQEMGKTALACNALLTKIYGPYYPIDANMQSDVEKGTTHLFTLHSPEGTLAAMSALVQSANPLAGEVKFTEIGRSAKDCDVMSLSDNPADRLSAQGILRVRAMRAAEYVPETDILYSTTRTAQTRFDMPGGYGVQRTWWGSKAKDPNITIPMITTAAGYDYRIGRGFPDPEPFNGFMIPAHPEQWSKDVNSFQLFVPPGLSRSMIENMFREATGGACMPDIQIASGRVNAASAPFALLQPATKLAGARYALTTAGPKDSQTSLEAIEHEFQKGAFSQKIILEADVASTPQGAGVLADLYSRGWSLAGWQPSHLARGGVCPVVTRVHPASTQRLVSPELSPDNFDAAGLADTRETLAQIYSTIKAQAERRQ